MCEGEGGKRKLKSENEQERSVLSEEEPADRCGGEGVTGMNRRAGNEKTGKEKENCRSVGVAQGLLGERDSRQQWRRTFPEKKSITPTGSATIRSFRPLRSTASSTHTAGGAGLEDLI